MTESSSNLPERTPALSISQRILRAPYAVFPTLASIVFISLSLWAMLGESATYDEAVHLSAGYSYLKTGDFRLNPEHPVLGKVIAALPLILMDTKWPEDAESWSEVKQWNFGFSFLYESGNDADTLLFWGRLPTILWGVAVLWIVYAVARTLFSAKGGLIALSLATFSPLLLAHSHYVTTDAIISAFYILALVVFWKLLQHGTYLWAILAGLCLGLALIAKYSAVTLLPILAWIAVTWFVRKRKLISSDPSGATSQPKIPWTRWALLFSIVIVLSIGVIWAGYGFRYSASPDPEFTYPFEDGEGLADLGRRLRILPEAYLKGYEMVMDHVQRGDRTFAMGQVSHGKGFWWYFPVAFLVKTPFTTLIIFGWGLIDLIRRMGKNVGNDTFFTVPLIIYSVLAIAGNLNLGARHLLPMYPIFFVLAGGISLDAATEKLRKVKEGSVGLLLAGTVCSTLLASPYFLAYFNEPSRMVWDRHEMLVGTNLDWGQDLHRLKEFNDRHGIEKVKLSYFGTASPRQAGLNVEILPGYSLYKRREMEWPLSYELTPGDYVAVSATNLACSTNPVIEPLRSQEPIAVVGHSIFIFRIDEIPRR